VFAANPSTLGLTAAGQNVTVALTGPAGCDWSAQSGATWLAVTPPSGNGSASLTVTVQPNDETSTRGSSIALGNLTLPVAQSAAAQAVTTPAPVDSCATLALSRPGDIFSAGESTGAQSFDVNAASQCLWSAAPDAAWITVSAGATGAGNGTVKFRLERNIGTQLRTGNIIVGTKTFTVNQEGDAGTATGGSDGGGDSGGGNGGGSSGSGAG
jgi:hypothetical protein